MGCLQESLDIGFDDGEEERQGKNSDGNVAEPGGIVCRQIGHDCCLWIQIKGYATQYVAVETVDGIAYQSAPEQSNSNVARIVDTEIKTRITVYE